MRSTDLQYLVCPYCQGDLTITEVESIDGDIIKAGQLGCFNCNSNFPIISSIPRFVPIENYASSFGLEWSIHNKTQYDSYTSLKISEDRFFTETGWPRDLKGQTILEVGSGSGRFTEQALKTGAFVVSMDYSYAVDANYNLNGGKENLLVVQADIYEMPFKRNFFDKLFCFGVLQFTPDVKKAFFALPQMLRFNGQMVIDVYKKTFLSSLHNRHLLRLFTRNMDPERLYRIVKRWIDFIWPITPLLRKFPRLTPYIADILCVKDYSHFGLKEDLSKEWSYLDTFDMLSPRYESPQKIDTIVQWFQEAGLIEVEVKYGYGGIVGMGKKLINI
jgi:SAM-dependent methyltransferase